MIKETINFENKHTTLDKYINYGGKKSQKN